MNLSEQLKKCNFCMEYKAVSLFTPISRGLYGVTAKCKSCRNAANRKNKYENILDLDGEIWKDIVGYEGYYQVSNLGRVKGVARVVSGKNIFAKLQKQGKHNCGYRQVRLSKNAETKTRFVHRIVAQAFIPNPENKGTVNHKNSNRSHNAVENLEWATPQEQIDHAVSVGSFSNMPKGENSHASILKESQVIDIKKKILNGIPVSKIAKQYPMVTKDALYVIKQGKSWNHLKPMLY